MFSTPGEGPDRPYRWNLDFGIYVPVAPAEMSSERELFERLTMPVPKSWRWRAGPGVVYPARHAMWPPEGSGEQSGGPTSYCPSWLNCKPFVVRFTGQH